MKRPSPLPIAALLVVSVVATARADVPPAPDSPDAHCSLAEQCPNGGVFCPYAFNPGAPRNPSEVPLGQVCRNDAATKGLERRCRSGGNYSGQELFCPLGATGTWKRSVSPPAESATPTATPTAAATATAGEAKGSSSCSASAGDVPGSGAWLLVGIAGAEFAFRRPRRAR